MALFEIHQRFKGHFLNELHVSFDLSFDVINHFLVVLFSKGVNSKNKVNSR